MQDHSIIRLDLWGEDFFKTCPSCHQSKHCSKFHKNKRKKHGIYGHCIECHKARQATFAAKNPEHVRKIRRRAVAKYRANNPEKARAITRKCRLLLIYGITLEEYDVLLSSQNGVCAICKRSEPSKKRLAIDHCHATGDVRGLLCQNCNRALGLFQDNADLLRIAIDYLAGKKS